MKLRKVLPMPAEIFWITVFLAYAFFFVSHGPPVEEFRWLGLVVWACLSFVFIILSREVDRPVISIIKILAWEPIELDGRRLKLPILIHEICHVVS